MKLPGMCRYYFGEMARNKIATHFGATCRPRSQSKTEHTTKGLGLSHLSYSEAMNIKFGVVNTSGKFRTRAQQRVSIPLIKAASRCGMSCPGYSQAGVKGCRIDSDQTCHADFFLQGEICKQIP